MESGQSGSMVFLNFPDAEQFENSTVPVCFFPDPPESEALLSVKMNGVYVVFRCLLIYQTDLSGIML